MTESRHLAWDHLYNARDLGGLPLLGGGAIRRGAVVRGDSPERLTGIGWSSLWSHGIRTVVDLQGKGETTEDAASRPAGLVTVHAPLDDHEDTAFWDRWGGGLDCTPLYYGAFLERFPHRVARAVAAVADAPDGGVFVHCGSGRDRTGLVVLVLLALAGVPGSEIAVDHGLSTERLEPAWRDLGAGDQTGKIAALIEREGTSAHESIVATAAALDARSYLRSAGLTDRQLSTLRQRLADDAP